MGTYKLKVSGIYSSASVPSLDGTVLDWQCFNGITEKVFNDANVTDAIEVCDADVLIPAAVDTRVAGPGNNGSKQ